MNDEHLDKAKLKVKRLILQYQEYLALDTQIKSLKQEKISLAVKVAKEKGEILSAILSKEHPQLEKIDQRLKLVQWDLERISDEMSFADPLIWMIYKDLAYKGHRNEIATLGDFKQHCSPKDYICTKRFKFMKKYLKEKYGCDLDDTSNFPSFLLLANFYMTPQILILLDDFDFMSKWKKHEYLIKDQKIAKWQA